jgi:hypothetical protein
VNANPNPRVSLKQYYTSARGIVTAAAAVTIPFASKVVGSDSAAYLFPPLGGMDSAARIVLVLLCLSVSIGVYFLATAQPPKSESPVIWAMIAIAIAFSAAYLAASQRFVRRIEVPSRESSVTVSVGYQRTQFAEQTFGSASDWAMLQARGTNEEEIERLWTVKSVILSRLALYLSCTLTTLSFLFLFSFALVHDIRNQLDAKTKGP